MKKVMFNPPFTARVIKDEQEKLFIAKSQDTAKSSIKLTHSIGFIPLQLLPRC